jgi:hypothetical protein
MTRCSPAQPYHPVGVTATKPRSQQAALWVLEDNERARRFYEAAGWRADGTALEDTTGGASLNKSRDRRPLGWRASEKPVSGLVLRGGARGSMTMER